MSEAEQLFELTDEQLVEQAISARSEAENVEAEAGSPLRWTEADSYLSLSERGWTQGRIAKACKTNQSSVSKFIACARRYSLVNNRPTFWHAFSEVSGFKGTLLSSDSEEWYTPAEYVDAARRCLGGIDLDPASCEAANDTVRAARILTKDDLAFFESWEGRVFLNPPYGAQCRRFTQKLRDEYADGNVSAAVLLVSAYSTETDWFQPLFEQLICFTDHRLRGWPNPTFGSAFVYFGAEEERFIHEFAQYGAIVRRVA